MKFISKIPAVLPGTYLDTARIAPVLITSVPYLLTQYTPLLSIPVALQTTGQAASLGLAAATLSAGISTLHKASYNFRYCCQPHISPKRHNLMLCASAISMVGLKSYIVAAKPVPNHPQSLTDLGYGAIAVALTTTLLWARRSKLKPVNRRSLAFPA